MTRALGWLRGLRSACLWLLMGCVTTIVPGCGMLQSTSLELAAADVQSETALCSGAASSYYLSKGYFRVLVDRDKPKDADKDTQFHILRHVQVNYRPDRDHGYCLDYLAAPTASDKVKIIKASQKNLRPAFDEKNASTDPRKTVLPQGGDGLLSLISTDAVDESAYIAKAIVRTIFTSVSGMPGFGITDQATRAISSEEHDELKNVLDVEYDPFDLAQTALTNDALKRLGFCIVLRDVTFTGRETIDSYCDDPIRSVEANAVLAQGLSMATAPAHKRPVRGILYRPRLPYTAMLFVKSNLKVRGGWKLRGSESVELENISPVVSIGIDRAFFSQRKTTVVFDQGVVKDVCIFKSSELLPLSEIPLEIAQSIVALPANIVQVKIDNTVNRERLLRAQTELMRVQTAHTQLLEAKTAADASTVLTKLGTPKQSDPKKTTDAEKLQALLAVGNLLEKRIAAGTGEFQATLALRNEVDNDEVCKRDRSAAKQGVLVQ